MPSLPHSWPGARVLLVIAVFAAACGTGISLEPTQTERLDSGGPNSDQEDGTAPTDAAPSSDAAVDESDASLADGDSSPDAIGDASARFDRSDSYDASTDIPSKGDGEAGADATSDAVDVGIDASEDGAGDAWPSDEGGSRDTRSDQGDVADSADHDGGDTRSVDVASDRDACTVGCAPDTEYYVDANAPSGGNGSKEKPFRTISAAIDAHTRAPHQARKAYVAAGTYDQVLGEVFPLVLRGLSLEGAGADQTSIVGSGTLNHAGEGGPRNSTYDVTIVVGDRALPTTLSGLSVRSLGPVPAQAFYGIFCDRGNATGEVASPAGQTQLDAVKIGPGYDTSVVVTTSTVSSVTGCNMLITRSTMTASWTGVNAIGCDYNSITLGPVILEMGTADPASGNTLSWMQDTGSDGEGVLVESCVVRASFQYNVFLDSVVGVRVAEVVAGPDPNGPKHPFAFKHNRFERLSSAGISERGLLTYIEEISDNVFANNAQDPNQSTVLASGMSLQGNNVGKVRRNVVFGNDVGVSLDGGAENADFGQPGDPGGNVFSCNSAIGGAMGSDIQISNPLVPDADAGPPDPDAGRPDTDAGPLKLLHFAGNSWDHVAPRVLDSTGAPNGVEISWTPVSGLDFDLTNSSLVTDACPSGRVP